LRKRKKLRGDGIMGGISRIRRCDSLLCVALLFMSCVVFSCAAPKTSLQVMRPAEVDMSDHRKIAVPDFQGPGRSGSQAASILTSEVFRTGYFEILERQQMRKILEEQAFSLTGAVDVESAAELGRILGVQALIFGEVTSYSAEDNEGTEKVKKKVWTGEYEKDEEGNIIYWKDIFGTRHKTKKYKEELVDEPYVVRTASVAINFRVVDVETAELLAVKSNSSGYNKKATSTDEIGRLPARESILDDLSRKVVETFVRQIAPYYATVTKKFEKSGGVSKQAIKMAQSGLWDEATELFEAEVGARPDAKNYYNLGICYEALGMYDQAEEQYKKAMSLKAKDLYIKAVADIKRLKEEREILREREAEE
jgi:curli biogenesis system outer membrane secretion channel CsgG